MAEIENNNTFEIKPPTLIGEEEDLVSSETGAVNENAPIYPNHDGRIELQVDVNEYFAYSLYQNNTSIVRSVILRNTTGEDIDNLGIRVYSDCDLIETFIEKIDVLPAGGEHELRRLKIRVHGDYLASLTERTRCNLYISVVCNNEELAADSAELIVLAFNEWTGLRYMPDLLVSFVMPNHPAINGILQSTSKYLEKWTGNPSIDAYQSEDPNRVIFMAAAAYAAIQELNITYASAPASYEDVGQRIRLIDEVMDARLGNCADLTMLYAATLEAMRLNPIMVMTNGHIFAGVWLIDEVFTESFTDDPSQLEKRVAKGINEMVLVECTTMCAGKNVSFDEARAIAEANVSDYDSFEFTIDVVRSRRSGIRPLPLRIKADYGYSIEHQDRTEEEVTAAPEMTADIARYINVQKQEVTKQIQWERKLLDLSMRNMLINMRMTGSIIPILAGNLGELEDALAEGAEFELLERPFEWKEHNITSATNETVNDLGPYAELISSEAKHHRLHSWLSEKELSKLLTKMYRSAKSSMEENGASTLYLTLGQLRWYDGIKVKKEHYAPLVLIPIDIIRKSANQGFVIRERDDESQVNITLLEYLKQNFDLDIPGLNPAPRDDHGLDIDGIFAIVRHAVMGQRMWDVLETAFIGNFSFSQFVMWNDIHNHVDLLGKNKIVRALMNGAVDWDISVPESVDTDDAYLPVPVDASQLRAVNMAANDISFVLHGPPGTGKSQTITAMIANALSKGKTVLFVAEKMAALEVVQKRLAALGIGDFCLELHSNKAVKKNVLDQLKRGLDIGVWGQKTSYDKKIDEIHRMRKELDSYARVLHDRRQCGLSVRELIDEYESIPEQKTSFRPPVDQIATISQSDFERNEKLLNRLIDAGKQLGHPKGNIFSDIGQTEYSQSFRMNLEYALDDYSKALDIAKEAIDSFSRIVDENIPVTASDWRNRRLLAEAIIKCDQIPQLLLSVNSLSDFFMMPNRYIVTRDQFFNHRAYFFNRYLAGILSVDFTAFAQRNAEANKKMFGKAKALEALTKELQSYVKYQVSLEQINSIAYEVDQYKRAADDYNALKSGISSFWTQYLNEQTTKNELDSLYATWSSQLAEVNPYLQKITALRETGRFDEIVKESKEMLAALNSMGNEEQKLDNLLVLEIHDNSTDNWLESEKALITRIQSNYSELREWIDFQQVRHQCESSGLHEICELYVNGLDHEDVIPVYFKSMYKALIWDAIKNEPVLNRFTGHSFNEKIKEYKKAEQEFLELTKTEMYHILTHNLPTGYEGTDINRELATLRKAISSGGRGQSIRSLFEKVPHVLRKLCPCLLMSPISVAQYLAADGDPYDIVIFDEASQLPTCKAVGVLARGENAVIVGDPNQMPPTSFFAGNMIDEDNLDIEDLDSILDDCLALGMPGSHLQWHYRSKHESLIAFSNQEYYDNSMLTFPSVNDRERRVRLCTINGVLNRKKGRVNEEEGEAVVREVLRRYNNPELRDQSIGIVTFNVSQQEYIEDLLTVEYKSNAAFDHWANEGEERLFVKNLENVQGDERDVILFSIGYAPDENGRFSLNFGPLNKEGGWKRLNVAVSRARLEMIVFSSMTPEMIDLHRTKAKGIEGLRAFLEYADRGKLSGFQSMSESKTKGIAKQICSTIEELGLKVQMNVGHSDFKIDMAVVNPYNEEEYLLGILLDGDYYKRTSNTKDREVAQIEVLQGLKWKLLRIWTMDWWDNREKEIDRLRKILEQTKGQARIEAEETKEKDVGPESEEITYEKPDQPVRKRTKKETEEGNSSFDSYDRFIPMTPHQDSKDAFSQYVEESKKELQASTPSGHTSIDYCLKVYKSADILEESSISKQDYASLQYRDRVLGVLKSIVEVESPISLDRLVVKAAKAFQISRSSDLMDPTEKMIRKMDYIIKEENGTTFLWKAEQGPEEYAYFRFDPDGNDRRSMNDVTKQELKNAVCITLKDKGAMDKDSLVKSTVKTMGYSRSGATLVEAVERGLKYGRETGEIIVNNDAKFELHS